MASLTMRARGWAGLVVRVGAAVAVVLFVARLAMAVQGLATMMVR